LLASGLTMFSGFGLGTLLMPVFVMFFPVGLAVAATAVVRGGNSVFKAALIGRWAERQIALRFGVPALVTAAGGAWVLGALAAFAGVVLGRRMVKTVTMRLVQRITGVMLALMALVLGAGLV